MHLIPATPSLSPKAAEFIASVLRLRPHLAVFDCDGTLWAGDAGGSFFEWELSHGVVPEEVVRWGRARYADYIAGKVDEDTMCGEMVTVHSGLEESKVQQAADQFFEGCMVSAIFPEMRELVRHLQESGCNVWAVSSTNVWVIRAGMKHCGIAENRVLAASVEIEDGRITNRVLRVPSGEGKPRAIRDVIRRDPEVAFGNSRYDLEMLEIARHAFVVNPNPDLEQMAGAKRWPIYFPDSISRR
jgi:HAD superfamily phosphoserine phosphatase-like hydrolase